jgi:hypothetical protein
VPGARWPGVLALPCAECGSASEGASRGVRGAPDVGGPSAAVDDVSLAPRALSDGAKATARYWAATWFQAFTVPLAAWAVEEIRGWVASRREK